MNQAGWIVAAGLCASCAAADPPQAAPRVDDSVPACEPRAVGSAPIRRITHVEYDNTVRDLLNDEERRSMGFPADEQVGEFDNDSAGQVVTPLLAESYLSAAEALAQAKPLEEAYPCAQSQAEDACARTILAEFMPRALRRPLQDSELDEWMNLFAEGDREGGLHGGLAMVVEVALQSPEFLYRIEMPRAAAKGPVRLSASELASRLSFLFWGTMPDQTLFDAARNGELDDDEGVRTQAERLINDPRTRVTVAHFFEQWLGLAGLDHLEKDASIYPKFDLALPGALRAETLTFVDDVVWNGDARLATLLTAPYTFLNAKLSQFYGTTPLTGTALRRVDFDKLEQRGGVLTQGSFLAIHAKFDQSSPVHRGKFVRERLLCTELPPPPADLEIRPPALDPRLTTRARFAQHATDASCASCHRLMDPIGLGFEQFDGVGLFREVEAGQRVDATGELTDTDVDGSFIGIGELAARLAKSAQVETCMARQWFQFAYGRQAAEADTCTVNELASALHGDGDLRKLLLALTTTPAFHSGPSEVQP